VVQSVNRRKIHGKSKLRACWLRRTCILVVETLERYLARPLILYWENDNTDLNHIAMLGY
jgi:hypothetical protein